MSLSKGNSRPIVFQGAAYRWAVSGDSGCMWLVVERADAVGQRLEVCFDYANRIEPRQDGSATLHQQRSITPGVVARVIEAALSRGWAPIAKGRAPMRIDDGNTIASSDTN
ncbi:MAG: hypothetical protein ACKVS9_06420 [Phycisphaerae bacterium]